MVNYHRENYESDSIPYGDEMIKNKLPRLMKTNVKMVGEKKGQTVETLTLEIKERT